ncbi:hypothetical protein M758_10G175100 [Ceratodon purpureus]|nr:hypothetical protein M758_10G175100 [Ceratodon purpureus]
MGVLPCAIGTAAAAAVSSSSAAVALLSLQSCRGEDWSFGRSTAGRKWTRTGGVACGQGLGRRGLRGGGFRRGFCVRSGGDGDGEGEEKEDRKEDGSAGRVEVEVSPVVLKQLEAGKKKEERAGMSVMGILEKVVKAGDEQKSSGLSLIEQNMKKRRERFGNEGNDNKPAVPLSFDVDARNDENRFDGAYFARLEELGEETLEINTLDDFYPAFIILITDALLELGDLMKMLGDGEFFSTQAMLRASRIPVQESSSGLKGFPEDTQLRRSLDNILVNVQALSFYISSLFAGPDGVPLNTDESLMTEADLLYNMYYKYKHKETLTVPLDERELQEQVLSGSGFDVLGKAVRCRQGLIFSGNWTKAPGLARQEVQRILDEKYQGLVAILLDKVPGTDYSGVLIAHKNELLSFTLSERGDGILASSLLFGVLVYTLQFANADVGFDEVYLQGALVALGFFGVTAGGWLARKAVAALYKVSHMVRLPFSLPVPHQGSFSTVVFYKGCLPDRKTLLDLSLSSAFASLAISGALIAASLSSWGSSNSSVADFQGLLLVPEQLFSYSSAFSWLVHRLSIATLSGEVGEDLNLVLSPLALAGVLGLHSTALGLLPVGIFDGGRIVTGIFGRDVQHVLTTVTFFLVAVSLAVKEPWLAVSWLVGTTPALMDDWFQIDEATQPDFIRKAVGLAMVFAAVGAFVPTLT